MKNSLDNHSIPAPKRKIKLVCLTGLFVALLVLPGCGGGQFLGLRTPLGAGISAGERYLLNIRADEAAKRLNQEHQSARSLSDLPMLEMFFRNAANPVAGKDMLAQQTLSRAMLYHQVLSAPNEKKALQIIRRREKLKLGYDIAKTYYDCLILGEYLAMTLPGKDAALTRSVRTRLSEAMLEYSALTGIDFVPPKDVDALKILETQLRSPIPEQAVLLRLAAQNRFDLDAELPPDCAQLLSEIPPHLRSLKLARILYETPGMLQKDYYSDPLLRAGIQNTLLLLATQTQLELAEKALQRAAHPTKFSPADRYENLIDLSRSYLNLKAYTGLPPETPYPAGLPPETAPININTVLPAVQQIIE